MKFREYTESIIQESVVKINKLEEFDFAILGKSLKKYASITTLEEFNKAAKTNITKDSRFDIFISHNSAYGYGGNDSKPYLFIIQLYGSINFGVNNITGKIEKY